MNRLTRSLLVAVLIVSTTGATVVGGVAVANPIPDDPSVPVESGTTLPFSGNPPGDIVAGDIVVDEGHGHVFVSGGRLETSVAVTDLDGRLIHTIPDLGGADGMVLSANGSTLYVGLAIDRAIAAVDTSTLAVTTYPTPGRCPRHLTQIEGAVYFTGSSCGTDNWYDVARLDIATGTVEPVTLAGEDDGYFQSGGQIVPDPARSGRFYVNENLGSTIFQVHAYELDSTGLTATRTATNDSFGSWVFGIDVSPDGKTVLAAVRNGVVGLDSTDLTKRVDHEQIAYSAAVAVNGTHVASAVTDHVVITDASGSYVRSFFFDDNVSFAFDSLAWGSDRLYGVANPQDTTLRLYTFSGYSLPAPVLTFDGSQGSSSPAGAALEWNVHATFSGQDYADRPLRVWRYGPDGLTSMGQPSTGPDGRISINDTPPGKGRYIYTVLYDGDANTAPAKLRWYHDVYGLTTSLIFDKPPVFGPGEMIVMTGRLTGPSGSPVPDATVELTQTYSGQTTALPSVTTDSEGNFSFETPGGSLGEYRFYGHYAGDSRYQQDDALESAWVKHRVVVELAAPPPYMVSNEPETLSGTVTRDDGSPVAGQLVRWRRYATDASTVRGSGTVTTAADGSFSFTDQTENYGPIRWQVLYNGDALHDAATDEVTVPVYLKVPSVDITTDRARYSYNQTASVEVWVEDGSGGIVRLYAEPQGQERKLVATETARPGRDLAAALTMTRNTRFTAVFEPVKSYRAAPKEAELSVAVRPALGQRLRGSYATSGRTYLVHRDVDPRLTLDVTPRLPGRCVHVRVERYRDGAFRFVRRTDCIALNRYSRARWTLTGNPARGVRFRLRYEAPGDLAFAGAKAPWAYLKFTR